VTVLEKRRHNPIADLLREKHLYHSFRLPDGSILEGAMPIEYLEGRIASFDLPLDLRGKRVLDVGPWDGYFTFAMEARGADVVAIDYVDLDTFRAIHRTLGSRSRYLQMDVYELNASQHGLFDYVLFLGVLYHLKHPLLALETLCAITRETCIVETFVVDGESWKSPGGGHSDPICGVL
jgi:tRNA (mo5U34)-methyltransferase